MALRHEISYSLIKKLYRFIRGVFKHWVETKAYVKLRLEEKV
jgi:hypothetical protein